jgi:hypothetical protein
MAMKLMSIAAALARDVPMVKLALLGPIASRKCAMLANA